MISAPNGPSDWAEYSSDSRGCVDIYYDGPGDNTVRPSTGELLKRAMAMREEIARWAAWDHDSNSSDEDFTLSEE